MICSASNLRRVRQKVNEGPHFRSQVPFVFDWLPWNPG